MPRLLRAKERGGVVWLMEQAIQNPDVEKAFRPHMWAVVNRTFSHNWTNHDHAPAAAHLLVQLLAPWVLQRSRGHVHAAEKALGMIRSYAPVPKDAAEQTAVLGAFGRIVAPILTAHKHPTSRPPLGVSAEWVCAWTVWDQQQPHPQLPVLDATVLRLESVLGDQHNIHTHPKPPSAPRTYVHDLLGQCAPIADALFGSPRGTIRSRMLWDALGSSGASVHDIIHDIQAHPALAEWVTPTPSTLVEWCRARLVAGTPATTVRQGFDAYTALSSMADMSSLE